MNPYTQADGEAFFSRVAGSVAAGETVLVAAFLGERIIGTAQLGLDMPPNQPHRAEVKKMLVHSDGRRQGIAGSMLRRVEEEALKRGRTLLILDTGSEEARRVYERGGWSRFGFVPDFALMPDGGFCDTTFYLKDLSPPRGTPVSAVTVRDATETDLPVIVDIVNDAIANTTAVWSDEPVDVANRRAWLAERREAGNPVLVAVDAGEVVGFGSYLQFRAWDGFRNAVEHSSMSAPTGAAPASAAPWWRRSSPAPAPTASRSSSAGSRGRTSPHSACTRRAGFIEVGRMPSIGEKFGRRLDLVFVQKQIA